MSELPDLGPNATSTVSYKTVSWYKYLIVSLVFSHLGFWSGSLFLIVPFPDLCLLVPSFKSGQRQPKRDPMAVMDKTGDNKSWKTAAAGGWPCTITSDYYSN